MIIGINGFKGAGKNEVGSYLEREYGVTLAAFADLLKQSAAACFGFEVDVWEKLKNDPRARVVVYREYDTPGVPGAREVFADISVRQFLQNYGTEAHRDVFGDNFWVDALFERLGDIYYGPAVAITDTRFENEIMAIDGRDGVTIRVDRGRAHDPDVHRSEAEPPADLISATIFNHGSLEDLYRKVDEWAKIVGLRRVQRV